jgi:hypothetical protein
MIFSKSFKVVATVLDSFLQTCKQVNDIESLKVNKTWNLKSHKVMSISILMYNVLPEKSILMNRGGADE